MQKEIIRNDDLLDEKGHLKEKGYAKSLLLSYSRKAIKACPFRIKEWDYYLVYNRSCGIALTIADNSYMGMISATILDFTKPKEVTNSVMTFMPMGKFKMPSSSAFGNTIFKNKNVHMEFTHEVDGNRKLFLQWKEFADGDDLNVNIFLNKEPRESMVIATPFKRKKQFYYNQKIVGFRCDGYATWGDIEGDFTEENSVGILDWGRGVWPYKNTWYWSAAAGEVDGQEFGFNLGYGFGDTSNATENVLFYDGLVHKLEDVHFEIQKDDEGNEIYTRPWIITSSDHRVNLKFYPIIDRHSNASAVVVSSNQHQVFGKFTGNVVLDNGSMLEIHDFMGFAEKVVNKW